MRSSLITIALGLTLLAPARADVVHLRNGRTMEGKVLSQTDGVIRIEVRGGTIQLPMATVARVEARQSPEEEYGLRARKVDMSDPLAVTRLSEWASSRGLGEEATQLLGLARGLELDQRVAAVRGSRRVEDWLEVLEWADQTEASLEVQRWLVLQAEACAPGDPRVLRQRQRLEAPPPPPPPPVYRAKRPPAPVEDDAQDEQVADLEDALAEEQAEADRLRIRVGQLERRRRIVRRRAAQQQPLFVVPFNLPPAPPCDAPPAQPCPPCAPPAGPPRSSAPPPPPEMRGMR